MTQVSTIRVVTVDDHDLLRHGLRLAIESVQDIEVVGEAPSGCDALELCARLSPDVVLMDLMMPEMDGVTAIRELRRMNPNIKAIALTSFVDDALVHAALSAGAVSYLMKNISLDELTSAIRKAYAGESMLSSEATQALVHAASTPPPPQYPLTLREKEVLTMMADGRSNQEISQTLNIGLSTVKKHVSSILEKMGTVSRTEAVIMAIRHKLVELA
jgi:two-component system, NarL family, response regulator LiaR